MNEEEQAPRGVLLAARLLGALLVVGAAAFGVVVSIVWRWVDCSSEGDTTCGAPADYQLIGPVAGFTAAAVMLFEALRPGGHPRVWFGIVLLSYAVWALYVWFAWSI